MANPRLIDMTNYRVGRITVTGKAGNHKRGGALWHCLCDCGNKSVNAGGDIRGGKVTSCGCLSRERIGNLSRTHGGSGTRIHNIWKCMRARCENPNSSSYKNYGGRGITVCSDWLSFDQFRTWAYSNGYNDELTIERVDVNGNYCPENCAWIPLKEQSKNRNYTQKNADGILWSHVAIQNGIPRVTYHCRVAMGWTKEEASTWPMNTYRPGKQNSRNEKGQFIKRVPT